MAWHAKNTYGYVRTTTEAQDNAKEIYNTLYGLGWTLNAVAAMLGNVEAESGYNPWRWQGETILPMGDSRIGYIGGGSTGHAYGLCQQDPAAKYLLRPYAQALPNFDPHYSDRQGSPSDGIAQLQYLHWICSQGEPEWKQWHAQYWMPFNQFITSTSEDIEYLTHVFFDCYERGTWYNDRSIASQYWYSYLQNYAPQPPDPPPPPPGEHFPIWLLFKIYANNMKGGYPF